MKIVFMGMGSLVFLLAITLNESSFRLDDIHMFLNIQSGLIVFGGGFFLSWAFLGSAVIRDALSVAIGSQRLTHRQALPHLHTLSMLSNIILSLGVFGVLVGTISCLMNLDNPSAIGPAMAIIYLSTLYSLSVSELMIRPLKHRIYAQQSSFSSTSSSPLTSSPAVIALGIGLICVFGFLMILCSFMEMPELPKTP